MKIYAIITSNTNYWKVELFCLKLGVTLVNDFGNILRGLLFSNREILVISRGFIFAVAKYFFLLFSCFNLGERGTHSKIIGTCNKSKYKPSLLAMQTMEK